MLKLYDTRLKICGKHYTLYRYSHELARGYEVGSRDDFSKSSEGEKREDSLYRTRSNVVDIINCNQSRYTKFFTLTYAVTQLDRKQALADFKKFRMRYKYKYKTNMRYLAVMERQKERGKKENNLGCWHFHLVLFEDQKYNIQELQDVWGLGGVKLEVMDRPFGLARYVAKYITKDTLECNINDKCYFTSQGLNQPDNKYYYSVDHEGVSDLVQALDQSKKKTYETNYVCHSDDGVLNCTMSEYDFNMPDSN